LLDVSGVLQNVQQEYLLGQAQDEANSEFNLALTYQNTADIGTLKVLVQYIQMILVTQLGVNSSTLITPAGQPLNGSLANCTFGTPTTMPGLNVTYAACYNEDGSYTLYDVAYTTDCQPYGLMFTGTTPSGSSTIGECVYDAEVTSRNLENILAGQEEAQADINAVANSIQGVIDLANVLLATENADFETLSEVFNNLITRILDLEGQLATAQNATFANSYSIFDIGDPFNGWLGLSNLGHGLAEIFLFMCWVIGICVTIWIARKLWFKMKESVDRDLRREISLLRHEMSELRSSMSKQQ